MFLLIYLQASNSVHSTKGLNIQYFYFLAITNVISISNHRIMTQPSNFSSVFSQVFLAFTVYSAVYKPPEFSLVEQHERKIMCREYIIIALEYTMKGNNICLLVETQKGRNEEKLRIFHLMYDLKAYLCIHPYSVLSTFVLHSSNALKVERNVNDEN